MSAKELYRAVGQIEDELILAANEPAGTRRASAPLWALAAAACFCLVCVGAFRHFFGTHVVWMEAPGGFASKSSVPEDGIPLELTLEEAADYYRIGALPAALGTELRLAGPDTVCFYTDADGTLVCDSAQLRYERPDGSTALRLWLARVSAPAVQPERSSRIRGVPVSLAVQEGLPSGPVCNAQWERNGTSVQVTGSGVSRTEFLALLEELLA